MGSQMTPFGGKGLTTVFYNADHGKDVFNKVYLQLPYICNHFPTVLPTTILLVMREAPVGKVT